MEQEILTLCDLSKYYTSTQSVVMGLNRVSLTFRRGEFVAITGESGSGKSTLAKVLGGLLPYESGEMLLSGRPTSHYDGSDWERYRSDSISFISQSYDILPGCSVLRNVVSALRLTGMEKEEASAKAEEILREVELWEMKNRRAAKLSSGQKQRLSIARALAKPAPILIADEPTGNLDTENSAKIVALLAAAAKERLVIMITHEFEEVAHHATRRITMQDGVVAADVTLRDATPAEANPVRKRTASNGMSLYTARLQISSRPVWSAIMLLFFAVTAFAVFAFLGTFIVNLDDAGTRVYDNSAFRNGDKERLVVFRADGEVLTEDDLAALLTVSHVKGVERYGFVSDINYFYREGIDYFPHYIVEGGSLLEDPTGVSRQVTLENFSLFVETIPSVAEGEEFLTAGRLPENLMEVVAGDESLLGKTMLVFIQDKTSWVSGDYLALEVTVVGTTDYGDHLFFHEQLGRSFTSYILDRAAMGYFVIPGYGQDLGNSFLCAEALYARFIAMSDDISNIPWPTAGGTGELIYLAAAGVHDCVEMYTLVVSPEVFEQMVRTGYATQMCLSLEDYAYTDEVLDELYALGYGALSPYQLGSVEQDEELAAERMQTLKVCLLALAAVLLLQIVVLRAMFSMEMEEYRLLANLGLRWKTAGGSVLWQIIFFALGGELLAAAAVALCAGAGIERIVSILRYLPAPHLLLILGGHLAASLLTTAWITHALRRAVYPVSGVQADITLYESNGVKSIG